MRITIDTEVLQRENLTLGDFLVLLMGFHDFNYKESLDKLIDAGIVQPNVFNRMSMVLSNNTRDYIAKILMMSNAKVRESGIDFNQLAEQLQSIFPAHKKPGTTYDWRGRTTEIAQKLMTLVAKYDFIFTEEEAIRATKEYVDSFDEDKTKMQLLKYFILRTKTNDQEIESMFMTIIENNRENEDSIR